MPIKFFDCGGRSRGNEECVSSRVCHANATRKVVACYATFSSHDFLESEAAISALFISVTPLCYKDEQFKNSIVSSKFRVKEAKMRNFVTVD
ncbi:MAG: hypothetical protein C5B54_07470 [Acidobacteria bacterium]|nr:MAG: hypothetical protein C5B54_07470 [Acidobacteriota bacterium]